MTLGLPAPNPGKLSQLDRPALLKDQITTSIKPKIYWQR